MKAYKWFKFTRSANFNFMIIVLPILIQILNAFILKKIVIGFYLGFFGPHIIKSNWGLNPINIYPYTPLRSVDLSPVFLWPSSPRHPSSLCRSIACVPLTIFSQTPLFALWICRLCSLDLFLPNSRVELLAVALRTYSSNHQGKEDLLTKQTQQ